MRMKVINQDVKKGILKLKVENLDDLWYLSHIIEQNDRVKGKTVRKIKIGESTQRNVTVTKKQVFLTLQVEKIDFSPDLLRVSGKITEGTDDVAAGSYHTFNIEEQTTITLLKEKWLKFQLDKIKEASKPQAAKILIVVMDREEALFATMQQQGYKLLTTLKGEVSKKAVEEKVTSNFYAQIAQQMNDYDQKYDFSRIILASPIFWKEEVMKEVKDEVLKKKILLASCSSANRNGITEVLKRPETQEALKQDRITKETNLVEELLKQISTNNLAVYGLDHTEQAVQAGAVKTLLITDKLIQEQREQEQYERVDEMLKNTESMKGAVHIISSDHEGGQKLQGLGGIGAILRYKIA